MVALVNLNTFKTFYGPQIGNGHVARATTRDGQPQGMGNHKGWATTRDGPYMYIFIYDIYHLAILTDWFEHIPQFVNRIFHRK